MMSKNSIVPFLKDYLIKFLTRPFLLDTIDPVLFQQIPGQTAFLTDLIYFYIYKATISFAFIIPQQYPTEKFCVEGISNAKHNTPFLQG